MKPEFRAFLRVLDILNFYSPDGHYEDGDDDTDTIHVDEAQATPFQKAELSEIDINYYLDNIYSARPLAERTLRRRLMSFPGFLCLVGPVGGGKTSIGMKLRRDLLRDHRDSIYICYIDIRKHLSTVQGTHKASADFPGFLRSIVRDSYMADLFPYAHNESGRIGAIELWAYLLDSNPPIPRPYQASTGLSDLREEAALLLHGFNLTKDTRKGYYEWLLEEAPVNIEVRNLVHKLRHHIEIPHLVAGARALRARHHQVIWFDNVDPLSPLRQGQMFRWAKKFQYITSKMASILVTLRDENIHRFDTEEPSAPPYARRVLLEVARAGKYVRYQAEPLPPPSHETIRKIIGNRQSETIRYQNQRISQLRKELSRAPELPEAEKAPRDLVEQALKERLEFYEPAMGRREYRDLLSVSARVLQVLHSEHAIALANNNLRQLLQMHRDFIGVLLRRGSDNDGRPVVLHYREWYLRTLFLRWIRATERPYKILIQDILEQVDSWFEETDDRIGCFLPYVLVNALWNLELELHAGGARAPYPTLSDLKERIEFLGYPWASVQPYLEYQLERRVVALRMPLYDNRRERRTLREVGLEAQLYVTDRGKCLNGISYSSFGFLYECLLRRQGITDLEPFSEELSSIEGEVRVRNQPTETSKAARELLPYLCDMCEMHTAELSRMMMDSGLESQHFVLEYRRRFGLPDDSNFRRTAKDGLNFGQRSSLLMESILESVHAYVREFDDRRLDILKLGDAFRRSISDLRTSVNFRGALGLAPRNQLTMGARDGVG